MSARSVLFTFFITLASRILAFSGCLYATFLSLTPCTRMPYSSWSTESRTPCMGVNTKKKVILFPGMTPSNMTKERPRALFVTASWPSTFYSSLFERFRAPLCAMVSYHVSLPNRLLVNFAVVPVLFLTTACLELSKFVPACLAGVGISRLAIGIMLKLKGQGCLPQLPICRYIRDCTTHFSGPKRNKGNSPSQKSSTHR